MLYRGSWGGSGIGWECYCTVRFTQVQRSKARSHLCYLHQVQRLIVILNYYTQLLLLISENFLSVHEILNM